MSRGLRLILTLTLPLAVAILVATLMPMPKGVPGNDKMQHMLAFGALALPTAMVRPRWALWSVLATVAYGGLIEVMQPWFGRSADLLDLRADAIGAVCGAILGGVLHLPARALWRRVLGTIAPQRA